MTITKSLQFVLIAGSLLLTALAFVLFQGTRPVQGSITPTQEYTATTTAANSVYGATVTTGRLIRTGQGALGSIVITGANTGIVNIYNATTTDATKRITATSTILMASIPASAVAGTYTFDVGYTDGLYIDLVSGTMPTSTVTYR